MLGLPLWERMILKRLWLRCFSTLSVLATLLIILDFGLQASSLLRELGWSGLPLHYLLVVSKRLPLLVSLAVSIGGIQSASMMVKDREWLALQVAGVPAARVLRPFLVCGIVGGMLLAANSQWVQPVAVDRLDALEASRGLYMCQLDADTTLLCRQAGRQRLEEVYWVNRSLVARASSITLEDQQPRSLIGFVRTSSGWERKDGAVSSLVAKTPRSPKWQAASWAETQPLSQLMSRCAQPDCSHKVQAVVMQRTAVCFLPLLGLMLALPGLLAYRRSMSWISALLVGLGTVLGGMTVLESASVVTSLGALPPLWAFGVPFVIGLTALLCRWIPRRS
jgi:lipopolysaccharide export LptBFGC system permease protein LptF